MKLIKLIGFVLVLLFSLNIVSAGLIDNNQRYFAFDNSSDFTDLTGIGSDATNSGTTFDANGIIAGARTYDGNIDYVDSNYNANSSNTLDFTMSMWVNVTGTNNGFLFGSFAGGTPFFNVQMQTSGTQLRHESRDSLGSIISGSPININSSVWVHFVLVRDDTNNVISLYIDGVNVQNTTDSRTGNFGTGVDWYIGQRNDLLAGFGFNGSIDEVSFWDEAKTQADITTLYNAGAGLQYPYTVLPIITIINPTDGTYYNTTSQLLNVSTDINTNLTYSLNGGTNVTMGNNINVSQNLTLSLVEGLNNLTVYSDYLSTVTNKNISFTRDTIAPSLNVTANYNSSSYTINFTPIINYSDLNIDYCNITLSNLSIYNCSDSITFTFNGNNSYNVSVVDLAGNSNNSLNNNILINPNQCHNFFNAANGTAITNYSFGGTTFTSNPACFSTFNDGLVIGSNTLLFEKLGFGSTNVTFTLNSTSELNESINITQSKIIVTIYDRATATVLTNLTEITLVATQGFSGNTTTGFLNISNINFLSESYQLVAEHSNYATEQVFFNYNNQELLPIDVYMLEINDTNFGLLTVKTVTSDSELIPDATCQLLEWFPSLSSFVTVAQGKTDTQGEFTFNIELDVKVYKILCNKGGVTATSLPTEGGIVSVSGSVFPIIMDDPTIFLESRLKNFVYSFTNSTEDNETQRLTFTWSDSDGLVTEACINIFNDTGTQQVLSTQTCASGASGQIQVLVFINNTFNVISQATVETSDGVIENLKQIIFEGTESLGSLLEKYNIDIILPLIVIILAIALGLSLEPQNIYVSEIAVIIGIWGSFILVPSVISLGIAISVSLIAISLLTWGSTR